MGRVSEVPTWELWGMAQETWIYYLQSNGLHDEMIFFYTRGIEVIAANRRDIIGTHSMGEITQSPLRSKLYELDSTLAFYERRLKELEQ